MCVAHFHVSIARVHACDCIDTNKLHFIVDIEWPMATELNSPACCFFFRLTAVEMSAIRSSSEQPLLIASLNEISVFPNRQT